MTHQSKTQIRKSFISDKINSAKQIEYLKKLRLSQWGQESEEHRKWQIGLLQVRYEKKFCQPDSFEEYFRDYKYYLIRYWRGEISTYWNI